MRFKSLKIDLTEPIKNTIVFFHTVFLMSLIVPRTGSEFHFNNLWDLAGYVVIASFCYWAITTMIVLVLKMALKKIRSQSGKNRGNVL